MRAAAWSIRPSSFGWIPSSIVMPERSAAPANSSAGTLQALATGEDGPRMPAQHVERGAAVGPHLLEQRPQLGPEITQAGAAVHEHEARTGGLHEMLRLRRRHLLLEERLRQANPQVPVRRPG